MAQLKDEVESLKASGGGASAANTTMKQEETYLKDELHQVKLELKDSNTENKDCKRQI